MVNSPPNQNISGRWPSSKTHGQFKGTYTHVPLHWELSNTLLKWCIYTTPEQIVMQLVKAAWRIGRRQRAASGEDSG